MRASTVRDSSATDFHAVNGSANDNEAVYSMHSGILFVQAAIVLLAGLLLPLSPTAIDVLLAVNFVFTVMLLFVVFLAREPAEITSVPLVVIFITLLRLGTNVGAAKSILLIANGGRIINWCGERVYYGFTSVIVTVILVFLICVLICKAITFIRRKAISYLVETIPNRQAILDAEFKLGIVTHEQMRRARNHIDKQRRFFAGMASTSSLLLCDCILILIITLATTFGATAIGIVNASAIMVTSQQYFPLALAIALITAVPAALVALALQLLINKRFLIALKVKTPLSQTIYVPSSVVDRKPAQQNIDVTAAQVSSENISKIESSSAQSQAATVTEFVDETRIPEQKENDIVPALVVNEQAVVAEAEPISPLPDATTGEPAAELAEEMPTAEAFVESEQAASPQIVRDGNYYDSILATVGDKEKAAILLVGQNVAQLPVTVAVELVINIIEMHKKCLLIDMDPARQAVATAFDIDSTSMQAKAVPTGIKNLWISPADKPGNTKATKLSRKVANALKVFDYVVIYAPNASTETVQQQLADVSAAAVIFGTEKETAPLEQFSKTLNLRGCRTISEQDLCMRTM